MSREEWTNARCKKKHELSKESLEHIPLRGRTTDPEAADFDEACEIFFDGMKLARNGDYKGATARIATAYLLDTRSINYVHFIPEHKSNLKMLCLEADLLLCLSQAMVPDIHQVTYGAHIIRIMLITWLGCTPSGQTFISEAMRSVNYLLQRLKEDPSLEDPNNRMAPLGNCLTRPNLLYHRSSIHMALGNRLKAAKDLTKALDIDPNFLVARDARVSLWAGLNLKTSSEIVSEYKIIIKQAHPDNRGLAMAYGRLASEIMMNPTLGTLEEAVIYYEKSLKASTRRAELYGPDNLEPQVEIMLHLCRAYMYNVDWKRQRKQADHDACAATDFAKRMEDLGINQPNKKMGHSCLKCGITAAQLGQNLSKCSRCKKVSYCSRKCQKDDWKEHKILCKTIPDTKPKNFASMTGLTDSYIMKT